MEYFLKLLEWFPVVEAVPYFFAYYCVQAARIVKRKSSDDISLIASSVALATTVGYTVYGMFFARWQYVASCVIGDIGWILIIALTMKYRTHSKVEGRNR